MKSIYLHDNLAKYGERFDLDVRDPAEAVHALSMQIPGFRETIEAGHWHVIRGPLESGDALDIDGVQVALGKASEVHILPAVAGAGKIGGILEVVAGVALIAASPFDGFATLAPGLALTGAGAASLLSPQPQTGDYSERQTADERPSFIFDGATNTSTQGLPVPLIYGRMRVGSIVVSAGLNAEDIAPVQPEG